jgi:ribosomal protein L34E
MGTGEEDKMSKNSRLITPKQKAYVYYHIWWNATNGKKTINVCPKCGHDIMVHSDERPRIFSKVHGRHHGKRYYHAEPCKTCDAVCAQEVSLI